jgi:phospholipid/cholesterol/gamma-HCH transport system substrate-binding protein
VPSRNEIRWSQLKVGALVLVAVAVLIALIFLMSGSTGGLFARTLVFRSYFKNASGLKKGAPVTLEGVTIGNVIKIQIVRDRNPTPVEVTMRVGQEFVDALHTDSTTIVAQAGVLGDSYVDISSSHAKGPTPTNNAELSATVAPTIQDVIQSSQGSIEEVTTLMHKMETLLDTLNSGKGTAGQFLTNPALFRKFERIASDLQTITSSVTAGKGTLGKLMNDNTLYDRANSAVDRLDRIASGLDEGKGTAGKLLRDDALYKNLNSSVANANELLAQVNAGKGAIGKLAKDPAFAQKLDDTVGNLDNILKNINEGKGTLGQLMVSRTLYNHTDEAMDQAQQLLKAMRENPKKYLVLNLKLF